VRAARKPRSGLKVSAAVSPSLGWKCFIISPFVGVQIGVPQGEAWAQYLPTIDASLTNSGTLSGGPDTNGTALGFGVTQRSPWGTTVTVSGAEGESHPLGRGGSRSSSWGVDVSQPLWRGFGTDVGMFDIRSARLGKLISRGTLELSVQSLIFNTRTAYSDCIRQIQNLEVNQRAVESAKVFLRVSSG